MQLPGCRGDVAEFARGLSSICALHCHTSREGLLGSGSEFFTVQEQIEQHCYLLSLEYQGGVTSLQFSFYSRPDRKLVLALFNGEEGKKGFERTY